MVINNKYRTQETITAPLKGWKLRQPLRWHHVTRKGWGEFWSLTIRPAHKYFIELKKKAIIDDPVLEADLQSIAYWAVRGSCDLITIPPHSGIGKSYAGNLARKIGEYSHLNFVPVFKDHTCGKRFCLKDKFIKQIRYRLKTELKDRHVLLFDDIAQTGFTILGAKRALRGNGVTAVVLAYG